jgi:thiamine-monophosphate kinase
MQLAISTDMLVAGTHFFADTDPEDLGWKTLAVNVSDLAAMGPSPAGWCSPPACRAPTKLDRRLRPGLLRLLRSLRHRRHRRRHHPRPLNLCPTIFGEVPVGQAITRSGGRPGDDLWVSGAPAAPPSAWPTCAAEIQLAAGWRDDCLAALQRPQPRVALGLALRGLATAMLDVSDGLLGDLGHILEQSGVGAVMDEAALPSPR